jgi:hypothetical protein
MDKKWFSAAAATVCHGEEEAVRGGGALSLGGPRSSTNMKDNTEERLAGVVFV